MMDISAQGQGLPEHLVIFSGSPDPFTMNMYYVFESFQISKLIGSSIKRRQLDVPSSNKHITLEESEEDIFKWRGSSNPLDPWSAHENDAFMSFLHVGGGKVYAVETVLQRNCGVIASEHESSKSDGKSFFRCISLSTPLRDTKWKNFEYKKSMAEGKYYPLIVEIGGLIYVLSGPSNAVDRHVDHTPFEVYNPLKDEWKQLPDPPFNNVEAGIGFAGMSSYTHLLIGNKLLVSTDHFSCTFDIAEEKWEACSVFSGCKMKQIVPFCEQVRYLIEKGICGPPFPFKNAIFYRKNIILCARPKVGEVGVIAFKISDDGEKADKISVQLDDFLVDTAIVYHLVDLGEDCFAALTCEYDEGDGEWSGDLVIVTYKVVSKMKGGGGEGEEGKIDSLVCERLKRTRKDSSCVLDKDGFPRKILYCFAM